MGFHPDEVYEAICNLTSMYNEVLSDAYDEADRLRSENEFLRRNSDRLREDVQPPSFTGEEENKRNTEMIDDMNSDLWESRVVNPGTGFDKGLADMLSAIKQPEFSEELPKTEKTAPAASASFEKAEEYSVAEGPADTAEIAEEIAPEAESSGEKKTAAPRATLNDKQIQRLRRGELLEILIESSRENEMLRGQVEGLHDEIASLNGRLSDRSIKIEKAGTLAEAALSLNGVFDAAQAAAQQYLDNLQALYDREEENCVRKEKQVHAMAERLLDDTNKKCAEMVREAEEKCAAVNSVTLERCRKSEMLSQEKCRQMEEEAKQKCDALIAQAELQAGRYWDELTVKLEAFYKSHSGLQELLASSGYISRG